MVSTLRINGRRHEYLCESASEISTLPKFNAENYASPAIGSTALVIATKMVYILSPSNSWEQLYTLGSGGSGGSFTADIASTDNVLEYVAGIENRPT